MRHRRSYMSAHELLNLQSSRKLMGLYMTFGLVIFQILPDRDLLYGTECHFQICECLCLIKRVIKVIWVSDLWYYMHFCTKYGW